jgi:hypothetical protein
MLEQLQEYFQVHTRIEHVGGKSMAEIVAIALVGETGSFHNFAHCCPACHIADLLSFLAVKSILSDYPLSPATPR